VRVLLDSNVWLAILTTDGACRQGWRLARASCQFFTAEAILFEIEDKLRLKFGFAPRHARLLTTFARRQTCPAIAATDLAVECRDPDDLPVLAAALGANRECLVTGDGDLLVLRSVGGLSILTPRQFSELVAARHRPPRRSSGRS